MSSPCTIDDMDISYQCDVRCRCKQVYICTLVFFRFLWVQLCLQSDGIFYTKNISYCKTKSKFTNSTSRQGEVIGLNHFKPLNPSWRLWGKQIPSTTQLWDTNGRVQHTECPVKPLTSTHHQLFKKQKQREPLQCINTTPTAVEIWTANWHGLKWTATIKKPVVFCWDVLT